MGDGRLAVSDSLRVRRNNRVLSLRTVLAEMYRTRRISSTLIGLLGFDDMVANELVSLIIDLRAWVD